MIIHGLSSKRAVTVVPLGRGSHQDNPYVRLRSRSFAVPDPDATTRTTSQHPTRSGRLRHWYGRIFGVMQFAEPQERLYRAWHASLVRSRVRRSLWMPIAVLLIASFAPGPFAQMREIIFAGQPGWVLEVLRFGILLPTCLALIGTAYSSYFDTYYARVAQIVAPLQVGCLAVVDALMRAQGVSLGAWMVLVILAPYFVLGLRLQQSVRTALMLVGVFALVGWAMKVDTGQWRLDLLVMLIAAYLGATIHRSMHRGVRKIYQQTQALSEFAHRDALTGIYNRRMFDEHLERLWQQAARERVPLALLIIDIDHFKLFNDNYGHQAGDETLRRIAQAIQEVARRPLDLAARYGGEEFTVLLYDARRDKVEQLCDQLQTAIAELQIQHSNSITSAHVTVSIGVACVEAKANRSTQGFVQLADEALYTAKEGGRNHVVVMDREYESLTTGAFRRQQQRRAS